MVGKRGFLVLVGVILIVLLGNNVKAINPLNMTTFTSATMNGDEPVNAECSNNWRIYITKSQSTENSECYGYFYHRAVPPGKVWVTGACTASGDNVDIYLALVTTASMCSFTTGTVTLAHDSVSDTLSYETLNAGTDPSYRRIALDGSAYEQSGFCNLTKASGSYNPTILSTPSNWTVYSKESNTWSYWNGTLNLSQAQVMINHSSGRYMIFENITTSSTVDYNLSGILLINDTSIGINDTYWPILKNNLCLDETKNITIKTPTSGTTLRKYNSTNGELINGSVLRSAVATDTWVIPAALGFSQYTAGFKSALTIYEANDPRYFNQTVFFYANYTNISNNQFIGGMNCSIWFSDWGNWTNMTNATSSGVYEFNRTFSPAGLYRWNVTCNESTDSFDWLMAGENITITNYSRLELFFYSPAADSSVNKHSLFNITTGVICRDYSCGNMTAALDPAEVSDSNALVAKTEKVTIVEVKETEVSPPWTSLAIFLGCCIVIVTLVLLSTLHHTEKTAILIFVSLAAFGFIIAQQPMLTGNVVYNSATQLVNMTPGATPFFTLNNNTYNLSHYACLNNLQVDQSCNTTWQINATGTAGNKFEFFTIYNSTTYNNLTNSTPRINITISAVCGNAICESGENCTTCSGDCGTCAIATSSGGGSFSCSPEWKCNDWSSCIDGKQTRICKDAVCGGFMGGKPSEEKECVTFQNKVTGNTPESVKENISVEPKIEQIEVPKVEMPVELNSEFKCSWLCWTWLILLILLILIITIGIVLMLRRKSSKQKPINETYNENNINKKTIKKKKLNKKKSK